MGRLDEARETASRETGPVRKAPYRCSYAVVTPEDLSKCLKESRRSIGLSQDNLAEMLEVQQPRVARIESRPASISVGRLLDIFEILQVELVVFPRQDSQRNPPMNYWALSM
ncbi:hypothetical protein BH09PSE6_BH09PSE6_01680 [soil metagenome]